MTSSSRNEKKGEKELRLALSSLRKAALERAARHPEGYLLDQASERIDLRVELPLRGDARNAVKLLDEEIERAVERALSRLAASRPGAVPCRACDSSSCEHAQCPDSRHVFIGYRSNGTPTFEDFGQWMLDRGDDRVDRLYSDPPGFFALPMTEKELTADLSAEYRNPRSGIRIRGQVVAGWYTVPAVGGGKAKIALSFQLLSAGPRTQLHIVGWGPAGESLEDVATQLDQAPWQEPASWAHSAALTLGTRRHRNKGPSQNERIVGLLGSLARRLEKSLRGKKRRTHHAENRHRGGERPTRMALSDLARADQGAILFDERHSTAVVLGDRGRTHFFNLEGRIVSSVRYSTDAIAKKRRLKIWRPATEDEIATIRKGLSPESDPGC